MSQRVLIIGVSESGKSSLARRLIAGAGLPYFVHDPIGAKWEGAKLVTGSMPDFIAAVEAVHYPRVAVVDEAGEALRVGQPENHRVFTRWRHDAILPIAIAQRYKMIAPNVRVNATDVYLFESARTDCEELSIDFNCPEMIEAANFVEGDFFHWRKGRENRLTRHRLW